jgi:hypothetical protein
MMDSKKTSNCSNCLRLQQENAHLKELLAAQNIPWVAIKPPTETTLPIKKPVHQYSPEEKIALFRRLFCGRSDVYPVRWESKKGGSGYSPACENEWRPGICEKPRIKCGACQQRKFLPVTDRVIYNHLAGKHTIGIYSLLKDDRCYFLATDFDESSWQDDALAFYAELQRVKNSSSLGNGLEELQHLLTEHNIDCDLRDERTEGNSVKTRFTGQLRSDQKQAFEPSARCFEYKS